MSNYISDKELIDDIRLVSSEMGEVPSRRQYNERGNYSYNTHCRRFGSWNSALEKSVGSINKYQNISEEELYSEIDRLYEELGRPPMQEDMKRIGEYSPDTYHYNLDGWSQAVIDAGYEPITRGFKSGKEHPDWKGGSIDYYGPNWSSVRKEILERDSNCCRICSESEERLCVHHINPRSEFVKDGEYNYEKANKKENLITLCDSCHMKFEGKFANSSHTEFENEAKDLSSTKTK